MMRYIIVSVFIFLSSVNASAQEISKSAWLEHMQNAIPDSFCQEQQYFRECFDVSGSRCLTTARTAIHTCISKENNNVPAVIDPATGKKWGNILGTCAGDAFEKELINKKSDKQKCLNPDSWAK